MVNVVVSMDPIIDWLESRPLWQSIPSYFILFFISISLLVVVPCWVGYCFAYVGRALHKHVIHKRERSRFSLLMDGVARGLCFLGGLPVGAICGSFMGFFIAGWVLGRDATLIGLVVGAPIGAMSVAIMYANSWGDMS